MNLYAHTRNNPLKYTDPDGRDIVLETQDKAEQKVIKQALVQFAKTKSWLGFQMNRASTSSIRPALKLLRSLENTGATFQKAIQLSIPNLVTASWIGVEALL